MFTNKLDKLEEVHKFLKRHEVQKLTQKETDNLIYLLKWTKFELVIKKQPTAWRRKAQVEVVSTVNTTKYLKD